MTMTVDPASGMFSATFQPYELAIAPAGGPSLGTTILEHESFHGRITFEVASAIQASFDQDSAYVTVEAAYEKSAHLHEAIATATDRYVNEIYEITTRKAAGLYKSPGTVSAGGGRALQSFRSTGTITSHQFLLRLPLK